MAPLRLSRPQPRPKLHARVLNAPKAAFGASHKPRPPWGATSGARRLSPPRGGDGEASSPCRRWPRGARSPNGPPRGSRCPGSARGPRGGRCGLRLGGGGGVWALPFYAAARHPPGRPGPCRGGTSRPAPRPCPPRPGAHRPDGGGGLRPGGSGALWLYRRHLLRFFRLAAAASGGTALEVADRLRQRRVRRRCLGLGGLRWRSVAVRGAHNHRGGTAGLLQDRRHVGPRELLQPRRAAAVGGRDRRGRRHHRGQVRARRRRGDGPLLGTGVVGGTTGGMFVRDAVAPEASAAAAGFGSGGFGRFGRWRSAKSSRFWKAALRSVTGRMSDRDISDGFGGGTLAAGRPGAGRGRSGALRAGSARSAAGTRGRSDRDISTRGMSGRDISTRGMSERDCSTRGNVRARPLDPRNVGRRPSADVRRDRRPRHSDATLHARNVRARHLHARHVRTRHLDPRMSGRDTSTRRIAGRDISARRAGGGSGRRISVFGSGRGSRSWVRGAALARRLGGGLRTALGLLRDFFRLRQPHRLRLGLAAGRLGPQLGGLQLALRGVQRRVDRRHRRTAFAQRLRPGDLLGALRGRSPGPSGPACRRNPCPCRGPCRSRACRSTPCGGARRGRGRSARSAARPTRGLLPGHELSRPLLRRAVGDHAVVVGELAHPGRLRGQRDAFEQHLAAEQRLEAVAQRGHLGAQRLQLLAAAGVGGACGSPPPPPARIHAGPRSRVPAPARTQPAPRKPRPRSVPRACGTSRRGKRRSGQPEGGDDPEPEIPEIVAEHQCEGGSDGEDESDDEPRPAQ